MFGPKLLCESLVFMHLVDIEAEQTKVISRFTIQSVRYVLAPTCTLLQEIELNADMIICRNSYILTEALTQLY